MIGSARLTRRHLLCCSAALAGGMFTGLAASASPTPGSAARDLVHEALHGLDASQLWDVHAHLLGTGDSGSGCSVHASMQQWWHPLEWTRRRAILSASGVSADATSIDRAYVERLHALAADFPEGARCLLFTFERAHDDGGCPRDDWSTDLVLKRRTRHDGACFATDVFATRRHFPAASSTVAGAATSRRRPNE